MKKNFSRYLSTNQRLLNWYKTDPWEKGSAAYKDIQTVRRMHAAVRKKIDEIGSKEDMRKVCKIDSPWCPLRNDLREGFKGFGIATNPSQDPYRMYLQEDAIKMKSLNQGEMSVTQFGFFGLVILHPEFFGIHDASEEDFEAICHTWRGIGYLLGIDDE